VFVLVLVVPFFEAQELSPRRRCLLLLNAGKDLLVFRMGLQRLFWSSYKSNQFFKELSFVLVLF
jgi:hypothetical protein